MRRQAPLVKRDAGDKRKTIAAATSLSVPRRRSGTRLGMERISGPISGGYWSMPLEAMKPGAIALTRTGAHSSAAVSVKLSMPARAAPECPMPGMPCHMSARMLTIAPPCSRIALRVALARHEEAAGEIRAHHRVPAVGADSLQRRGELAAGVVDQRVDAAVPFEHGGDGRAHRGLVADVAGMRARGAARGLDLGAHRGELVGLAADEGDRRAERSQLVRRAAPDARAAAGDDGDLAREQVAAEDGLVGQGMSCRRTPASSVFG